MPGTGGNGLGDCGGLKEAGVNGCGFAGANGGALLMKMGNNSASAGFFGGLVTNLVPSVLGGGALLSRNVDQLTGEDAMEHGASWLVAEQGSSLHAAKASAMATEDNLHLSSKKEFL